MFKKHVKLLFLGAAFIFSSNAVHSQSFDEALKLAKSQNKMVIVDVYTDWCGWCKKMDKESYSNSDVKKIIDDNFILVRLDAEGSGTNKYQGKQYTNAELAGYFQVSGFPTTVFLSPEGSIAEFSYDKIKMKSLPGYYPLEEFKKVLEYFKAGKYKNTDLSTII